MRSSEITEKMVRSQPNSAGTSYTATLEDLFAFTCYSHRYTQVLLILKDWSKIIYRHGAALPRTGSVGVIKN